MGAQERQLPGCAHSKEARARMGDGCCAWEPGDVGTARTAAPKVTQRTERVESRLPTPTILTGGPQAPGYTVSEEVEEKWESFPAPQHTRWAQPPPAATPHAGQSPHHTPPSPGRTCSTSPTSRHAGLHMSAAQSPSPNERIPSSPRKPLPFTRHYVHTPTQPPILYGAGLGPANVLPAPRLSCPVPVSASPPQSQENSAIPRPSLNTPVPAPSPRPTGWSSQDSLQARGYSCGPALGRRRCGRAENWGRGVRPCVGPGLPPRSQPAAWEAELQVRGGNWPRAKH